MAGPAFAAAGQCNSLKTSKKFAFDRFKSGTHPRLLMLPKNIQGVKFTNGLEVLVKSATIQAQTRRLIYQAVLESLHGRSR
jgi:hypothetical protein